MEVTSEVAHSHNTRQEPREATRRINNATITRVTPHVPRRCVQITGTSFGQPRVWGSNLFYLFKHVGQYNALNPGPQFAAITGNPAGLLFRRKIWGARDNGVPPRSTPEEYSVYAFDNVDNSGQPLNPFRLSFSEPKCALGGGAIFFF